MEIETPVLLAYAIEDSTDIFRISVGVWTPQTPPPSRYATASRCPVSLSICPQVIPLRSNVELHATFLNLTVAWPTATRRRTNIWPRHTNYPCHGWRHVSRHVMTAGIPPLCGLTVSPQILFLIWQLYWVPAAQWYCRNRTCLVFEQSACVRLFLQWTAVLYLNSINGLDFVYILVTNLMHWLLFIHKILFSCTCFEPQVLIFYQQPSPYTFDVILTVHRR